MVMLGGIVEASSLAAVIFPSLAREREGGQRERLREGEGSEECENLFERRGREMGKEPPRFSAVR